MVLRLTRVRRTSAGTHAPEPQRPRLASPSPGFGMPGVRSWPGPPPTAPRLPPLGPGPLQGSSVGSEPVRDDLCGPAMPLIVSRRNARAAISSRALAHGPRAPLRHGPPLARGRAERHRPSRTPRRGASARRGSRSPVITGSRPEDRGEGLPPDPPCPCPAAHLDPAITEQVLDAPERQGEANMVLTAKRIASGRS